MSQLLLGLAALACPVGMGLMMFFMMRGMGGRSAKVDASTAGTDAEVTALRAEVDQLRAAQRDASNHEDKRA